MFPLILQTASKEPNPLLSPLRSSLLTVIRSTGTELLLRQLQHSVIFYLERQSIGCTNNNGDAGWECYYDRIGREPVQIVFFDEMRILQNRKESHSWGRGWCATPADERLLSIFLIDVAPGRLFMFYWVHFTHVNAMRCFLLVFVCLFVFGFWIFWRQGFSV